MDMHKSDFRACLSKKSTTKHAFNNNSNNSNNNGNGNINNNRECNWHLCKLKSDICYKK